jgi:hypothetical protein
MRVPRTTFFNLRKPSLLRGCILPLLAMGFSLAVTGFPEPHPSPWLLGTAALAAWGAVECFLSLQKKWSLLHAGILLLFYTNLMILATIVFMMYFLENP